MCPLRVILIFLSATLAGFFVLRNLKSQRDCTKSPRKRNHLKKSFPCPPRSYRRSVKGSGRRYGQREVLVKGLMVTSAAEEKRTS